MTTIDVTFRATWITDVATSTSVQVWKTDRAESDKHDIQVRPYAGGRMRAISTPRRDRSTPLTFRRVSEVDMETLREWAGRLLLLRDAQGWRRWGTHAGIAATCVSFAPEPPLYDVALTFTDLTYTEAV